MTGLIRISRISYTVAEAVQATWISEATIRTAIADGSLLANCVGAKGSKPVLRAVELDAGITPPPTSRPRPAGAPTPRADHP